MCVRVEAQVVLHLTQKRQLVVVAVLVVLVVVLVLVEEVAVVVVRRLPLELELVPLDVIVPALFYFCFINFKSTLLFDVEISIVPRIL